MYGTQTKTIPEKNHVLVVEDDHLIGGFLQRLLVDKGFQVITTSDGFEAEKIYRNLIFDLIIADILVPGKDGLEIIRDVHKEFPHTKIIAISGGGKINATTYLKMAERLGADRVLKKPFESRELLALIRELLPESAEFGNAAETAGQ